MPTHYLCTSTRTTCRWKYDEQDDCWETECGNSFQLNDGTPVDNSMQFCPYCGRHVTTTGETLRERIAAAQHEIWSHWMFHLSSVCGLNRDGTVTISADKVARWQRQMNTPYSHLSESEQASDLRQADKVVEVL